MAGNVNYYYKDGELPEHTKLGFREHIIIIKSKIANNLINY